MNYLNNINDQLTIKAYFRRFLEKRMKEMAEIT